MSENNEIELIDQSTDLDTQTDVRIAEYNTRSSTLCGHANAACAIAMGAMSYRDSPWLILEKSVAHVF